jgi:hypothetical protein
VRVQLTQAEGIGNEEIFKKVKKTILRTAAIRVLYNGDIDVTVPDEASKDRAQELLLTEALKIYKKDYFVKILNIPFSVRVACEKEANNTLLTTAIYEALRLVSPGLQITRIRWLYNPNRRMRNIDHKPAKTRKSLIVGLLTQKMQRRAIRGRLIIDAQLFEVRPFERSL